MRPRIWIAAVAGCWLAGLGCGPGREPSPPTASRPVAAARPASRPAASRPMDFFAAVGSGRSGDPAAAAEEATGQALAAFRQAGVKPVAAVFVHRGQTAAATTDVGRRVREVAGVPTYGQGSAGSGGLSVLLLGGVGLEVKAFALGGEIPHDDGPEAAVARVRKLRAQCIRRGEELGEQVGRLSQGGLAIVLGAMEGEWQALFCTGLHKRMGAKAPLVGCAGGWAARVYSDGRAPTDGQGTGAQSGQLVLALGGRISVAAEPVSLSNPHDPAAVAAESRHACRTVLQRLEPARPRLLLAFGGGSPDTLRDVTGPDVPIFAIPCVGQAGTDADGNLHVGSDRIVCCAVGEERGE